MDVVVPKNGIKEVPVQFKAGAVGIYTLLLAVSDKEFAGASLEGINTDQCSLGGNRATITVETEVTPLRFLSAPGIGLGEIFLIAGIAGLLFVVVKR
jgi:hypothetical protein